MTIGVLVTARMGSSRLKDKHLRPICGQPALSYLLARIEGEFAREIRAGSVLPVLTTGDEARNHALAPLCEHGCMRIFFGDNDNVPHRHLQAAEKFALNAIVSVDGDDLFCAPEAMRSIHNMLAEGAQVARTIGLPLGMNSWGYSTQSLRTVVQSANTAVLETGWGRIFEGIPAHQVMIACPNADAIRATLDYEEDLRFFTRGISEVPTWASLATPDLVRELIHRGIHRENAGASGKYWENFAQGVSAETIKDLQ